MPGGISRNLQQLNKATAQKRICEPAITARFSLLKKKYHFVKMHGNDLVNRSALRPRGPFLFRSTGKGSKRGRFARHFGSGKKFSHEPSRSANLSKLSRSRGFRHMERFVFTPAVRGRGKNPLTSHAVRFCGRYLGLPSAVTLMKAGCENCVWWSN